MIKNNNVFWSAFLICLSSFNVFPNLTVYAQVQDNQAVPSDEGEPPKLRCSDGSLADSSSECPSSDQCPSSTSGNHLLQCTPNLRLKGDNLNATEREVGNTKRFQSLNITTDKKIYKPGEVVNITIKNTGAVALTFPNSILGLTIQNAVTHEKYPLFSAPVITTLDSGGQKLLKWNQTDSLGQQVKDGNYTASTSSGLINANTTFSVIK